MTAKASSIPTYDIDAGRPARAKKRGRPPKEIQDRVYRVQKPVRRKEESHPKARRLAVVMFLYHHRIFEPATIDNPERYRRPTQREAAAYFQVKQPTISCWWRQDRESIERDKRAYHPKWPQLEKQPFQEFIELRRQQRAVTTAWFRKRARDIFLESVSSEEQGKLFMFSNGWWTGFRKRYNIVKRRVTKRATQQPEEYEAVCGSWCRFLRRVQHNPQISPLDSQTMANGDNNDITESPRRRFEKRYTVNVDETPIPYTNDSQSTWEILGSKTVSVKTVRSGWEKRQATAIFYIFGDGECRLDPTVIFKGSANDKARIFKDEGHLYAPGITVIYNEHAYNNEDLFSKWIKNDLSTVKSPNRDFLLVMDAASFHLTEIVNDEIKKLLVTPALIPAGCTGLIQPLDTTINKLFKQYYREEMDYYEIEEEKLGKTEWSVKDRRIMTTWIVKRAWDRIKTQKKVISDSFLRAGITIRPDGSQDTMISIKGIENIDFTGWQTASEISFKSEELVDRLCDKEELAFGPDEYFDDDTLEYALKRLKVPQLKELAARRGISSQGIKLDIVERLRENLATQGTLQDSITVQIDSPDVVFDV